MTGLDLESFLLLLRTDLKGWAIVVLSTLGLALLIWFSWGARRGLRKCLVASLVAHLGIAYFASDVPAIHNALNPGRWEDSSRVHIRQIRVAPESASQPIPANATRTPGLALGSRGATSSVEDPARRVEIPLDQALPPLEVLESTTQIKPARPEAVGPTNFTPLEAPNPTTRSPIPVASAVPTRRTESDRKTTTLASDLIPKGEPDRGVSSVPVIESPRVEDVERVGISAVQAPESKPNVGPAKPTSNSMSESLAMVPDRSLRGGSPSRSVQGVRSNQPSGKIASPLIPRPKDAIPIGRGTPTVLNPPGVGTGETEKGKGREPLVDLLGAIGHRPIQDVPSVYRPRLDPNRAEAAKRAGASDASEQAVENALAWLARHQDQDGRWDGGTARDTQGNAVDDDDFTAHCPPGQICFGECVYWEADTALTGLVLLTFLGSGQTHTEGRYKSTVENGLRFLLRIQEPNGDLRGRARAVGMYCHAMAALALCEAYALTGDERLREPATNGVRFAISARAKDRKAWRYSPGEPIGDTSILGWIVMLFKSARESGITIPDFDNLQAGILRWLDDISSGTDKGLAKYQPKEPVTPSMTAEAWVCRQFLGEGRPGAASEEAALHLLSNPTDRGKTNLYYWYYATLAMYQHGGEHWRRWNATTRDKLVKLQRTSGHMQGSWDPDESIYGVNGGRIYCTAMAAMTLEVYYRYLRLYDQPRLPSSSDESGNLPALVAPKR